MEQDIENNAAKEEQPEPGRDTPETIRWEDMTGREKVDRFMWAFRKMKTNYSPRHDGGSWR